MSLSIPVLSQAAKEATIQPGVKARIILQSRLSSKLNEVDDPISAVLDEPVYVDGQLVLPRATEFRGRVTAVKPAGRAMKNGQIGILFDRIIMNWGEEPISVQFTSIDDWDKDEKLKSDEEGNVDGKRDGRRTAENVALGGTIGGAGAGVLILTGGGGRGAAALGGAGLAGGLLTGLLLTKGGDIQVRPGAVFRLQFVKPLTLPVIYQPGAIPRPIEQERKSGDGAAKEG
jgi:hypothetical protein